MPAYLTYQTKLVNLHGRLPPGQRLVRREVAKRLGVSPIPVAEALLRLEVEGLVQSRPLYGSRVRPLTLEDVENDAVLREALECQTARVCAENAGDSALARLKTQARRLDKLMAEGDPHSQLGRLTHQEFHLAIAQASPWSSLAEELQRIWFRRLMWMNWIKATHYRRVPADWHQQLVAALATRDPDRAEAKTREHVRHGHEDDREALRYSPKSSRTGSQIRPAWETTPPGQSRATGACSGPVRRKSACHPLSCRRSLVKKDLYY